MADLARVRVVVSGRVQGVFFRDFTRQKALALGLTGYARNLPNGGSVEVKAEGERLKLEELVSQLRRGPPPAVVEKATVTWREYSGKFSGFEIRY